MTTQFLPKLAAISEMGRIIADLIWDDSSIIGVTWWNEDAELILQTTLTSQQAVRALEVLDLGQLKIPTKFVHLTRSNIGTFDGGFTIEFDDGAFWTISVHNEDFTIRLPKSYTFTQCVIFRNGAVFKFPHHFESFSASKAVDVATVLADELQEQGRENWGTITDYEAEHDTKLATITYTDDQTGAVIRSLNYKTGDIFTATTFKPGLESLAS